MIPKQAIEKAIEGGWKPKWWRLTEGYNHIEIDEYDGDQFITFKQGRHVLIQMFAQVVALDSTFWQALGKALGWQGSYVEAEHAKPFRIWNEQGHHFIELVWTGGDKPERGFNLEAMARGGVPTTEETASPIEKFWNELLANPQQ
jgi:hypothetical protein